MPYPPMTVVSDPQFARFSLPELPHRAPFLRGLGRAVRERRERRRLSAAALAAAVGVEEERLRALERGELDPGYELLLALADTLGVRSGVLVTRAEELAQASENGESRPAPD